MKMRDLTPSNDMNPDDARSICQFLTASNVRFRRVFHEDYRSVDYTLTNADLMESIIDKLSQHKRIGHRFTFKPSEDVVGKFTATVRPEEEEE